ncbi:MAG: TolB family protein [Calditrichia bacterium]
MLFISQSQKIIQTLVLLLSMTLLFLFSRCSENDADGDGILDANDNCSLTQNPEQDDFDGDGIGHVCDSTVIMFENNLDNDYEIFTWNLESGKLRQLMDNNVDDIDAVWSPDRAQIAFRVDSEEEHMDDIYIMDSNGNNRVNITAILGDGDDKVPSWSKDGKALIFQHENLVSFRHEIWKITFGSNHAERLIEENINGMN